MVAMTKIQPFLPEHLKPKISIYDLPVEMRVKELLSLKKSVSVLGKVSAGVKTEGRAELKELLGVGK